MTGTRDATARPLRAASLIRPRWASVAAVWPQLAVIVAAVLATCWAAVLLWRRYEGLGTGAYDLGFFQQVIWNLGTSGSWVSSFHEGSFLGLHFSPILVVPAALERLIGGDARVLIGLHAIGIGALVPATFLFLRAALRPSPWATAVAAGLSIGLPVWATMQWVLRSDFHPELFGVILALLAGWAGLTGRPRTMWILAMVALATREDVAYAVATIGLLVAVRGRGRMRTHARALVAAAVVWAVIVFVVLMPWLRDGLASDTARYYRWLGDGVAILTAPVRIPDRLVAAITQQGTWFVVAGMLVGVAGLPLLRPRWLLLLVPPLVAILLSAHPPQAALIYHYPLILVVPLLVATAMGGRRALAIAGRVRHRRLAGRRRDGATVTGRRGPPAWTLPLILVVALIPATLGAFAQGSVPPFDQDPVFLDRPPALAALRAIAAQVPADAPLVTDEGLVTPLASRVTIRRLTAFGLPARPAFVLIDRQAWSPSRAAAMQRDRILAWLPLTGRPILADDGRFVLWGPQPADQAP